MTTGMFSRFRYGAVVASFVLALTVAAAAGIAYSADDSPAQQVYYNARVYTSDKQNPSATAFVIENGKFVYVGDDAGALKYGTGVDLEGKRIIPGLLDSHCHPVMASSLASLDGITVDLEWDLKTTLDHLEKVANDDEHKDVPFIVGMGIGPHCRPNLAVDLDRIIPDRPVMIVSLDGHASWLNSKAMALAGLTKDTPDPIPGSSFFERDADGNPSGYVVETTAVVYIMRKLGLFTVELIRKAFPEAQTMFNRHGFTGIYDSGFATVTESTALQALREMEDADELKMRTFTSYHYLGNLADNPENMAKVMKENRAKYTSELVRPEGLKLFADGTVEVMSAWMFDDFFAPGEGRGFPVLHFDDMLDASRAAIAEGFNIHTHAIGDRAISTVLDLYSALGKTDSTKTMCHVQVLPENGIERFARRNDIFFQTTPVWLLNDPFVKQVLGEERFLRQVPLASMLKAGVRLTFGSDYPIARGEYSVNPFNNMWVAVNRSTDEQFAPPRSEGIAVKDCVDAYTINGAMQFGAADEIGSITVGKSADFVVCSDDIFEIDPGKLNEVTVEKTYLRGKPVYVKE